MIYLKTSQKELNLPASPPHSLTPHLHMFTTIHPLIINPPPFPAALMPSPHPFTPSTPHLPLHPLTSPLHPLNPSPHPFTPSPPHLEDNTDVIQPLGTLQCRVPLTADGGQTDRSESLVALPYCMDVGNVQVGQSSPGVVGHIFCTFALCVCVCVCVCVCLRVFLLRRVAGNVSIAH